MGLFVKVAGDNIPSEDLLELVEKMAEKCQVVLDVIGGRSIFKRLLFS